MLKFYAYDIIFWLYISIIYVSIAYYELFY